MKHLYGLRLHRNQSQGATCDGVLREYITLPEYSVAKILREGGLEWVEKASLVCAGSYGLECAVWEYSDEAGADSSVSR